MRGKTIVLRAPEPTDTDILYQWENDSSIWHLGNTLSPYSRFEIEQFILANSHDIYVSKQLRFMIDYIHNDQKVTAGAIDVFDFDPHNRRAGVGVLIDEPYRKQGIATEALEVLIKYCFQTLNLHQLFCNIESNNTESIRLFSKLGFVACGTRKDWLLINQKWKDEMMMQLLNPALAP